VSTPAGVSGSADRVEPVAEASGSVGRAGLVVTAASFVGHLSNYLFYVVTARMLGPAAFAEVSALVAFATLIFQPFNGVQVGAARDVARMRAAGRAEEVGGYLRALFLRVSAVNAVVLAAVVAGSSLLRSWLHLESATFVVFAGVWIVLGTTLLVAVGAVQGLQRFGQVAWQLGGPLGALRVLFLPLLVLAAGVSGSMLAMAGATLVGLITAGRLIWPQLRTRANTSAPVFRLGIAVVTLIAFASMINVDIIVAKAALPPVQAASYSSAALIGKIALYAPAALALVLLPRVAARLERGENADRLVLNSQLLTLGAAGLVVLGLALVPSSRIEATFGAGFSEVRGLLVPLALVMTVAALLNVHVTCAMAAHDRRFAYVIAGTAVLHLALLAVLHRSPLQIICASAIAIGTAFVVQEVISPTGVVRLTVRRLRDRAPA